MAANFVCWGQGREKGRKTIRSVTKLEIESVLRYVGLSGLQHEALTKTGAMPSG